MVATTRTRSLISLHYPTRGARKVVDAQARRLPSGFGRAMDDIAEIYKEELVSRTPVGRGERPGRLRSGWRVRRVGAGGRATRIVYNRQSYLRFVLAGRGEIDQRKKGPGAKRLRFVINGRVIFRWKVKAARANPFHIAAKRAARARVRQQYGERVRAIFARTHSL